jgi:hypothetical protein
VGEINRVYAAAEPIAESAEAAAPTAVDRPPVIFEASGGDSPQPVATGVGGFMRAALGAVSPRPSTPPAAVPPPPGERVSTTRLAKRNGVSNSEMFGRLVAAGLLDGEESRNLTPAGVAAGGVLRSSARFGDYVTWPPDLKVPG